MSTLVKIHLVAGYKNLCKLASAKVKLIIKLWESHNPKKNVPER